MSFRRSPTSSAKLLRLTSASLRAKAAVTVRSLANWNWPSSSTPLERICPVCTTFSTLSGSLVWRLVSVMR
ncbi:hypothetical protein D3C75_1381400 [compost metagenome]